MIGNEIYKFAKELWPLNRSITGDGLRNTLQKISRHLPALKIKSVLSGTKVFDWKVPLEWHVTKAYIVKPDGKKICDFSKNNLHLVGYSAPFHGKMSLEQLQNFLYSIPKQPKAIPYITSYYKKRWGFCITEQQRKNLESGEYEVVIDSKLFYGKLNYGELIIKGKSKKEIFLSTYICHPSMANNELSGISVTTFLAKWLSELPNRNYTYRIVFVPETIGSITYISKNIVNLKKNVIAGFNVSCVGDERSYSYLPSRNGKTISDQIAKHVLKWTSPNFKTYSWLDRGSDERQYCAPGIDLPIASILRTKYGEYDEYHTSLDNFDNVVTPNGLNGGYWVLRKALEAIEKNKFYKTNVMCEPQMSKRNLYPTISTKENYRQTKVRTMMNVITYCDNNHSLLEIAEKINVPIWDIYEHVEKLVENDLISEV